MNSSEIISISILWCIGLLALIQALNARGAIRVSLTWIITVAIVLIAIVITYIQISNNDPPLWAKSMSSTSVSTSSEATSKKDTFRLKAYALSSKKLSSELESLIKSIEAFDFNKKTKNEAEKETWERQALSLKLQTEKLLNQARNQFHPQSCTEAYKLLLESSESLRLAGYGVHIFSTLEDPIQKKAEAQQILQQIKNSKIKLKAFEKEHEKLNQALIEKESL